MLCIWYDICVVQLECLGIISFMFAMVPFQLLCLVLRYIAHLSNWIFRLHMFIDHVFHRYHCLCFCASFPSCFHCFVSHSHYILSYISPFFCFVIQQIGFCLNQMSLFKLFKMASLHWISKLVIRLAVSKQPYLVFALERLKKHISHLVLWQIQNWIRTFIPLSKWASGKWLVLLCKGLLVQVTSWSYCFFW